MLLGLEDCGPYRVAGLAPLLLSALRFHEARKSDASYRPRLNLNFYCGSYGYLFDARAMLLEGYEKVGHHSGTFCMQKTY